jgi:hypothetical protein
MTSSVLSGVATVILIASWFTFPSKMVLPSLGDAKLADGRRKSVANMFEAAAVCFPCDELLFLVLAGLNPKLAFPL